MQYDIHSYSLDSSWRELIGKDVCWNLVLKTFSKMNHKRTVEF